MSSISAGTTSTTTLVHSGDTTGSLVFKTNDTGSGGTTAVTLDTSQNATFAGKVTSAGALTLASNGTTTAVTIDTSQNVGIGTTSPSAKLHVESSAVADLTEILKSTDAVNGRSVIYMASAKNSAGTQSNVSMEAQSVSGANADLVFRTSGSNITAGTERMRITSAGEVLVNGTAAPVNGLKMAITNGTIKWSFGPDGSGNYCVFNASSIGVYVTNGATSWTGTSDERLKTNLRPIENGLQKVNSLRSVTGRFITDDEGTSRSFLIAQDVQAVLPEAVHQQNDELGTLGVAYTDVIPLLVASIKELKAINDTQAETINALTARVVALESK